MKQYTCYFNKSDALLNIMKALVEVPEYQGSKMSRVILTRMTKCLLPSKKCKIYLAYV